MPKLRSQVLKPRNLLICSSKVGTFTESVSKVDKPPWRAFWGLLVKASSLLTEAAARRAAADDVWLFLPVSLKDVEAEGFFRSWLI